MKEVDSSKTINKSVLLKEIYHPKNDHQNYEISIIYFYFLFLTILAIFEIPVV
jgi:hypothetical protein